MLDVLHRAAGRVRVRLPGRAQAEPTQEPAEVDVDSQMLYEAIKREFPFMSDDCIWQVISEM
ncbi:hypothetical protein phiRKBJ001_86 [Streptomyces phage phiRKBJ001]|nr:hypothetical protein phiRKBJ001_86 [Streptomyces phage phiRKBJ001]